METSYHNLTVEKKPLYRPPLDELANGNYYIISLLYDYFKIPVLREGLRNNFQEVEVEVVDCPDLTKPPFTLVKKGKKQTPQKRI